MLDQNLPELKVLDYTPSLQRAQTLDARQDFQFRGIYKLLLSVFEWTEKFSANRVLPTVENLESVNSIEREKAENLVNELCFRQNPPLLKKLNVVELLPLDSGPPEILKSSFKMNTVFCRPITNDAGNAYRYAIGLNESSSIAIKNWFQTRRIYSGKDLLRNQIFDAMTQSRLLDTYASTQIGNLFQCPLDKTKQQKDTTIAIHLKPILKKLVDDKVLFFLRNDKASKPGNKSIFVFNKQQEIQERFEIYLEYAKEKILPGLIKLGVMNPVDPNQWSKPGDVLNEMYSYINESYGEEKTLMEELILFHEIIAAELERQEKLRIKAELEKILKYLEEVGKVVEINSLRVGGVPLEEDFKAMVIANSSVLYHEFADAKVYNEFLLHKGVISKAIESAKQKYVNKKNDIELRILSLMNVYQFIEDEGGKRILQELENQSLFSFLPFFTKLIRSLFGSRKVLNHEAQIIKAKLKAQLSKDLQAQKTKKIQQEKERIALQRVKEKEDQEKLAKQNSNSQQKSPEKQEEVEEDPKTKETLDSIIQWLDSAWEQGKYPDRVYLMSMLGSKSTEDQLIFFLKKFGGKDIYSFQVRNQNTKYPWPILISATYLKKNGKKLLGEAKALAESLRSATVPDQEKFDLVDSLVDFLERTLPKIKSS